MPKSRMKLGPAVEQARKYEQCFLAIVAEAKRESKSFEWILEQRKLRIHAHPNWGRLSASLRDSVNRFTSGALETLHVTGLIIWQHYLDGQRIASKDREGRAHGTYLFPTEGGVRISQSTFDLLVALGDVSAKQALRTGRVSRHRVYQIHWRRPDEYFGDPPEGKL